MKGNRITSKLIEMIAVYRVSSEVLQRQISLDTEVTQRMLGSLENRIMEQQAQLSVTSPEKLHDYWAKRTIEIIEKWPKKRQPNLFQVGLDDRPVSVRSYEQLTFRPVDAVTWALGILASGERANEDFRDRGMIRRRDSVKRTDKRPTWLYLRQ